MPPMLEAWDLAIDPVPTRSRLYALAPIGIGTAFMRDSDRFPAPDEAGACAPKTLPASDR